MMAKVCKRFDLVAQSPDELERRLRAINEALEAVGARVFSVTRAASRYGRATAQVRYAFPLSGERNGRVESHSRATG
jgi:hypothetical protein